MLSSIALSNKILSIYVVQVKFLNSNKFDYRVDFKIVLLDYREKLINWKELNSFKIKLINIV